MKTREIGEWSNLKNFKTNLFRHIYYKKNQHIHFLVHEHSSRSAFGLHLVRDPKASLIGSFKKLDHGETWTIFHGPTSWSMV